jgi:hypothetical protein
MPAVHSFKEHGIDEQGIRVRAALIAFISPKQHKRGAVHLQAHAGYSQP